MKDQSGIVLRRAGAADVEPFFEIRTSVAENHMSREELAAVGVTVETLSALLQSEQVAGFVVTRGGRALGFSMARADLGDVFALFVRPDAQGAGLGSRLLSEAERWLKTKNVRSVWLLTGDKSKAVRFYEKRGWRRDGSQADGQIRFVKRFGDAE